MIPVKDYPGLYRDEYSNAILNCSEVDYQNYMKMKNTRLKKEDEIMELKKEIDELKNMIHQLLNK